MAEAWGSKAAGMFEAEIRTIACRYEIVYKESVHITYHKTKTRRATERGLKSENLLRNTKQSPKSPIDGNMNSTGPAKAPTS